MCWLPAAPSVRPCTLLCASSPRLRRFCLGHGERHAGEREGGSGLGALGLGQVLVELVKDPVERWADGHWKGLGVSGLPRLDAPRPPLTPCWPVRP